MLPFKNRLPDATDLEDRVSKVLEYLVNNPTSQGRSALVAFLELLCIKHPEPDPLNGDLKACLRSLRHQDAHKGIPYVVVAMIDSEAQKLANGQGSTEGFESLRKLLPAEWETHYHNKREDWQIHGESASPVGEILEETFVKVGIGLGDSYSEKCFPSGLPSKKKVAQAQAELERIGGILIIDAISLFYRPLCEALHNSGLASGASMAVLVFSPVYHRMQITHKAREVLENITNHKACSYIKDYCSGEYEIGVWSLYGIQRWLYATLPYIARRVQGRFDEHKESERVKDYILGRGRR